MLCSFTWIKHPGVNKKRNKNEKKKKPKQQWFWKIRKTTKYEVKLVSQKQTDK